MKKILFLIACLPLVASSCSDSTDNTEVLNDPRITLSSWSVSFPEDGGAASVALAVNRGEMIVENDNWLTVSIKGLKVGIVATVNPDGKARTSVIRFTLTDRGKTAKDSITVWQSGLKTVNLSETETANCYVAPTGGDYRFRADIKGNGSELDGKSRYIEKYGLKIEKAAYADLIWEATYDADKNTSRDIIAGKPVYSDGEIRFSTGTVQGNAVIALKDPYGTILWSWHIWVCDEQIGSSQGQGQTWMDRNLGALNNTPRDINNRGMLYQWGRKDPFLPSRVEYIVTEFVTPAEANQFNTEVGEGSGVWNYNQPTPKTSIPPGNMEYAVRRPTSFLTAAEGDWFVGSQSILSNLWGETDTQKTIFDPCPAGYMIPLFDAWSSVRPQDDWGSSTIDGIMLNGRHWTAGTNDFYPLSGFLQVQGGKLNYTGALGMYWTRLERADDPDFATRLYLGSNSLLYSVLHKGSGCLIRCVKQ